MTSSHHNPGPSYRIMRHFVFLIVTFLITVTNVTGQSITGTYSSWWASTWWEFRFLMNNTYIRTSSGHYGNTVVNGEYKVSNDTIILVSGFKNTHGTVNEKYLIDGDSCIIDIDLKYDYCKTKTVRQGNEGVALRASLKRNILYPQVPAKNPESIKDVESILQQIIDRKSLEEFYDKNNLPKGPLVIQEYFEIKDGGGITLTKFGQPVLFKSAEAINREGIKTFVEINDFNISSHSVDVHLDYWNGDVDRFTVLISFYKNKTTGLWEVLSDPYEQ